MHKKMLAVSDLYDDVSRMKDLNAIDLENARDYLYAGQCNCPYWHGVFGGLYLPHLRWAVYKKLIKAEKLLRRLANREVSAVSEDRDRDGQPCPEHDLAHHTSHRSQGTRATSV